jgi:hypothetical protein
MPTSRANGRSWLLSRHSVSVKPRIVERGDTVALAIGGAVLLCAYLLVGPVGNTPIDDDFSYADTAFRFCRTLRFEPHDWTGMPLISDVVWSCPFQAMLGQSFQTLRIATLAIGLLIPAFLYMSARMLGSDRSLALVCALTVALNPMVLSRSYSFMTDIYFAAFATLGIWAHLRWIETGRRRDLTISLMLAIAASLSRQIGLFLPLAFAASMLASGRYRGWRIFLTAVPTAAVMVALLSLSAWLRETGHLPSHFEARYGQLLQLAQGNVSIRQLQDTAVAIAIYLGLLLLPVTVYARLFRSYGTRTARLIGVAVPLLALGGFFFSRQDQGSALLMPYLNDTIVPQGIGPISVWGAYDYTGHPDDLPELFWIVVTALGAIGFFGLVRAILLGMAAMLSDLPQAMRKRATALMPWLRLRQAEIFLSAALVIYALPLAAGGLYDRYLIVMLVPLVLLLQLIAVRWAGPCPAQGAASQAGRTAVSFALLAGLAWFGIAGTRDLIRWNTERWAMLHALLERDVSPSEIDGGFEFNGTYNYWHAPNYTDEERWWWWVVDDYYTVAFRQRPGYCVVMRRTYPRWLTAGSNTIVLLRRVNRRDAASRSAKDGNRPQRQTLDCEKSGSGP